MTEHNKKKNETPIYSTPGSTLQSGDEAARDKSQNVEDETISISRDDLHETEADRLAGSDRAGTAERKDNSV